MRNSFAIPAVSALALALAACASAPNANLEKARADYDALQSQPQATQLAALETKDAGDWLKKSDEAYRKGENEQTVDQLAYLTQQRVALAMQTVKLKMSESDLQKAGADRAQARLDARTAQLRQLQQQLQAKQTSRGTLVTFGDVLFDLNKADLKPSGMQNVQQLATFLQQNPERKVVIEGFTDSTGSASYNQGLSERRAYSVQRALISMGVDASRISAMGYGKADPVAPNDSASNRALNRRVEVTISNDSNAVPPRQM